LNSLAPFSKYIKLLPSGGKCSLAGHSLDRSFAGVLLSDSQDVTCKTRAAAATGDGDDWKILNFSLYDVSVASEDSVEIKVYQM
jgi:hypothetical protein